MFHVRLPVLFRFFNTFLEVLYPKKFPKYIAYGPTSGTLLHRVPAIKYQAT